MVPRAGKWGIALVGRHSLDRRAPPAAPTPRLIPPLQPGTRAPEAAERTLDAGARERPTATTKEESPGPRPGPYERRTGAPRALERCTGAGVWAAKHGRGGAPCWRGTTCGWLA